MNTPSEEPLRGLAATLVRRPVTLFMLFLTLVGTGLLAYQRIPLTLLPDGFSGDSLNIYLPYPGAAPAEVEDQLAIPVEEALETIPGIKSITSQSSEGQASISVEFSSDSDMDIAYGEVRDRIERIRASLPPEMDRYFIRRWSQSDLPIVWIGVQYDADSEDPYGPIERIAVPRLDAVEGVANVRLNGVVDEAVRIFVDIEKVKGYGVDLGEIIRQMQNDNFTMPAGDIDEGNRNFAVRLDARYKSIDDIRRYPVGNNLVMEDIAEVVRAYSYRDSVWRIGGQPAVGIGVGKESGANTVETATMVEEMVASFAEDPRLDGITFNVFFSQRDKIERAVTSLKESALWGGLFAVAVLFLFLRNVRMTLLAALAIPSSLVAALAAVYFSGATLNILSLTGFTIGIGMLVDNAVVVIESIAKRRRAGSDRLHAASEGAREVGLAVLTATLTSVVVFLPLAFMDGDRNTRIVLRALGLPISYSLLASLLVALVFLPAFAARLLARTPRDPTRKRDLASPERPTRYARLLAWTIDNRLAAVVCLAGVVMAAYQAGKAVPKAASGGDEGWSITVAIDLPRTYTLSDANGVFERYEAWADENIEDFHCETYSANFTRRNGTLQLFLNDDIERVARESIPRRLRAELPVLPGVETTVGFDVSGSGKEFRLNLEGPDFGVVADTAEQVAEVLKRLEVDAEDGTRQALFETVKTDLDAGLDEVQVLIDRERSNDLGVNPQGLQGMIAWGLGGQRLPDLQLGDTELAVLIEYGKTDEESLEFLRGLEIPTDSGEMVPLAAVAGLDFDRTLSSRLRRDGRTSMGISATPSIDDVYAVSLEVAKVKSEFPLPKGYRWTEEGGREEVEQVMEELGKTLTMSVALVYLLMAMLLESIVLPLAALLSIGLALLGVNFALALFGQPLTDMVFIGMILLAGIVVNNGIVLMDHVQRLRNAGLPRREALLQGGVDRVRPILMTALTTICGLLPMAAPDLFPGSGNRDYQGMAIAVAGGLAVSTALTLLVVPLFYTLLEDLAGVLRRLARWRSSPKLETTPLQDPPAA